MPPLIKNPVRTTIGMIALPTRPPKTARTPQPAKRKPQAQPRPPSRPRVQTSSRIMPRNVPSNTNKLK